MNKRLRLPLALSLALGSSTACALGLGQIEVKSGLNQPLSAEIPVVSNQAGETDALAVRLAPPEALARVGLPAPTGMAANLEFALETRPNGQTVIKVTTPGKINDPFVTFLLEVDWGKGRMLREYTVLLDPPTMAPVRSAPVATAPVAEPATTEALPEAPPPPPMTETEAPPVAEAQVEPEPAAETPAPPPAEPIPPAPEPQPEPARERVDTYGPVAAGETLWSIAQYARPDESISMNQMMLALLYANPDAFIDQNINRLKKGAILRIPGREEALATAVADAAAQVREQMQNWRQAAPPVSQPAEPEPDATTSAPRAPTPTRTESRLELVPPRAGETGSGAQSGASVEGEGAELRAELARSKEETASVTRENVELKSRVQELEKIQSDSRRLIELKDSELKAAQEQLAALQAREAATAAAPEATDALPADATPAPTDESATTPAETPTDPASVPPTDEAATATTETPPTDATPAPTETPTPVVSSTDTTAQPEAETTPTPEPLPPPPAPWYLNLWVLIGAALVIVGGIALALTRRRKVVVATPPRYGSGELASSVAATSAAAREAKVKVAPPPREAAPDRGAVLAEAVARDPGNLNRHLELVRHHYQSGDAASFEQAAEAMYARVYDPENLAWKQVVAMGHEIAPEHPLFVQEAAPAPAAVVVPAAVVAPAVVAPPAPVPAPVEPAAREVDWSRPAPAPSDVGTTQQMRIDEVRQARPAPAPVPEPEPTFEPMLDFEPATDFDNDAQDSFAEPAPAASDGGFIDADAASTKLELARAYLDMGDVEGARGMLEEVVSEGNPGQRAEAKRLLDEIR